MPCYGHVLSLPGMCQGEAPLAIVGYCRAGVMERPAFAWEACSMVLVQRRSQQVLSHVTFKQCLCLKLQLCPRLHMNPSATLEVVYEGGSESGISVPEASQPEKDTHSGWMTPRQCSVHHALLAHHLCCMDLSSIQRPER